MRRKRIVSVLLVFSMLLASINFDMLVKAGTASNTVGDLQYFTGSSVTNNFNVKGKYNDSLIQITYGDEGYSTYYKTDTISSMTKLGKLENGASQTTSDGLKITQNLSFCNNQRYVKVTYTVENTNTESKTFSIGSCADVQIAANDAAAIKKTTTGLRMSDTGGTGAQFNLIARNAYGVTDVDTLWYGPWSQSFAKYQFTDVDSSANTEKTSYSSYYTFGTDGKVTSLSGLDSSICYSWTDRPIAAGSVQEYSVMIGIGSDAEPPILDINSDVYMNLTGKSRGSSVDVSAAFTDAVGRQDSIFYAFDNGDGSVLKTVSATGVKQSTTGSFIIPETWEDNSLHLISLWLMNDKGAMSDTKKVYVYINPDDSSAVQEAVPYTLTYASGGASGTNPSSASVYEKNKVTMPVNPYTIPSGKKFGGWSDGTGVYLAGESYTMPSNNVTMTAVWIDSGVSNYCIDYYQQNVSATGYTKTNTVVKSAATGESVTLTADDIDVFTGFTEVTASRVSSGTVSSSTTLHLKLYYDRNNVAVSYMDGASTITTQSVKYGATLTMPSNPSKTGFTFTGWNEAANGSGNTILTGSFVRPDNGTSMNVYSQWTVNPITLSGTSEIAATYGVAMTTDAYKITASGGTGNYTYTITPSLPAGMSFSSDGKFSGTPTVTADSASYTVTGTDSVSGAVALRSVSIGVAKKILTVSGAATTNRIYDGTDSISVSTLGTLELNGKLTGDDVSVTTTGGTYNSKNVAAATTITLNGLALTGNDKDKYQLASSTAVLTGNISKKIIAVKIDDAAKKVGTVIPVFGVHEVIADGQVSALVNGDTISSIAQYDLTTVATADSPVGTYSITGTAQNINSNYDLTIINGTLNVTQNAPSQNGNYVIEGNLNSSNQWYSTAAVIKPYGSFDKIKIGTSWADSVTVNNSVSNVSIQLKNSTTGEITSVLADIEVKSDSLVPSISVTGIPSEWKTQDTLNVTASAGISGIKSVTVNGNDITSTYGSGYTLTQNGSYVFTVTSNAGLTASQTVNITNIDTVKPNNAVITDKDKYTSAKWYNTTQTITAGFIATPGSPERVQHSYDAGTNWIDGATADVMDNGKNTLIFRVIDEAGNTSDMQAVLVQIDKIDPESAEITAKGNSFKSFLNTITFGLFYDNTVDLAINASDSISGIKSVEYQKVSSEAAYNAAGTWINGTSLSVSPDEKFIVYARITDNAGNVTIINTNGIVTDNTRPALSLSDVSGWKSANVTLEVTASDALAGVKEVTYTTDETVPQAGTVTLTDGKGSIVLRENGQYVVTVTAKDNSGNTITQTADIRLDKTVPALSVTGAPTEWKAEAVLQLQVSAGVSGIKSVTVNGDDITSTYAGGYKVTQNGTYVFTVTGNSGLTVSQTVVIANVDSIRPNNAVITDKENYTSAKWYNTDQTISAGFTVISGSPEKVQFSTDGGNTWADGTSTIVTKEGKNTVLFKVTDAAGNVSDPQSVLVQIDKTRPESAEIKAKENSFKSFINNVTFGLFYDNSVEVAITAADELSGIKSVEYQKVASEAAYNAAGTWTNATSLSVSPDEKFIVYARITDNAGNFTIINTNGIVTDDTKPTLSLSDVSGWKSANVTLDVTANDALAGVKEVTYTTDETAPQAGKVTLTDGKGSIVLKENGQYVVTVTAKDNSGNTITQTANIRLDKTVPVVSVTGAPTDWKAEAVLQVQASAGVSGIKSVTVNGDDITSTYAGGYKVTQSGTYIFTVTGNSGLAVSQTVVISTVDSIRPNNAVIADKDNYTSAKWYNTDQTISAGFTALSGSPEKVQFSTDGGNTWADGTSTIVTKEGKNTVLFRVTDAAGNISDPQSVLVQIDKTRPENTEIKAKENSFKSFINNVTFGLFYDNTIEVAITAADALSGIKSVEYQKVASEAAYNAAGTWTNGTSLSVSPDEKFIVYARITDNAGNVTIINTNGIITDDTKPTLSLSDVSGWKISNVNVEVNAEDILAGLKEVTYTTDETVPQTGTVSLTDGKGVILLSNEGQYKLTVTAKDNSGNTVTQTADIKLDKTKPVRPVISAVVDTNSKKVTGSAEPASVITITDSKGIVIASGIAGTDGSYSIVITKQTTGTVLNVTATDIGGNISEKTSITVQKLSNHVSDMIDALPNPDTATVNQILSAQNDIKFTKQSYDALDEDGRAEITADRKEKLNKLLNRLNALLVITTKDTASGVTVDGVGTSVVVAELDSSDVSKVEIALTVNSITTSLNTGAANILIANTDLNNSGQEILAAFDISLIKSVYGLNGSLTSTSKVNNNNIVDYITVRIPVPAELIERNNLSVVYVDDNGTVTRFETKIVMINGVTYAEFQTNHFSEYAIVGDVKPVVAAAATGDMNHTDRLVIMCVMSSLVFATFRIRRKRVKQA